MQTATTRELLHDCRHELNCRTRGQEARIARLIAGGVITPEQGRLRLAGDSGAFLPTANACFRATLQRFVSEAGGQLHEQEGGVFHCCTVRVQNGIDPDLPTRGNLGCRISEVPIRATLIESGTEFADQDEPIAEPFWLVRWGNCGTGFMEPRHVSLDQAETAAEAEELCRDRLLARGDCTRTRAEAVALVSRMLVERAVRMEQRRAG